MREQTLTLPKPERTVVVEGEGEKTWIKDRGHLARKNVSTEARLCPEDDGSPLTTGADHKRVDQSLSAPADRRGSAEE